MFTRPSDSVILHALTEESTVVAEAVTNATNKEVFNSGQTSKEWFSRRIKYQRTKNQKVCWLIATSPVDDADVPPRRVRRLGVRVVAPSTDRKLRN